MTTSHVTAWPSDAPTPAQFKELYAQIESGRVTNVTMQALLRGDTSLRHETLCRNVLAHDLIFPEDIAEAVSSFKYLNEDIAAYHKKLPNQDLLWWLRKNEYAVVAGPPEPMSLVEMYHVWPTFFQKFQHSTFRRSPDFSRSYASNEKVLPGWLRMKKSVVADSFGFTMERQVQLLTRHERLPNIAEVAWFLFVYRAIRKSWLLVDKSIVTSTLAESGTSVRVGFFTRETPGFVFDEYKGYTTLVPVRVTG